MNIERALVIGAGGAVGRATVDALFSGTAIGEAAAAAYGGEMGESIDAYLARRFPEPLDPRAVAAAVVSIAAGEPRPDATLLGVTARGIRAVTGR